MHINDLRNSVLYNLGDSGGILTYKGSPVDSGGGGGGITWREVTGSTSVISGGEYIIVTAESNISIEFENLDINGLTMAEIHVINPIIISSSIGGVQMYNISGPCIATIRRKGANLLVQRSVVSSIAPSFLMSYFPEGLVLDMDASELTGSESTVISSIPSTFGPAWGVTAGAPYVHFVGGHRGVYFGSGHTATANLSLNTSYTIALVASSNNSSAAARVLNGLSNNWLIGPYSGSWQFYGGSFTNMRSSVGDLMVIVVSRTSTGTFLAWRAADGSVATTTRGADYLPGILQLGSYEPANSTVFEIGLWNIALGVSDCQTLVTALSTRWEFE